ncbi:protein-lysine N-methyltransferase Ecym_6023 [Eremothecium cymbalariae DBVPG|uniref:SET domain-containing protein n=1 Tax=Eremothecium cymbalariae (strain CBS 270.75 / DBVPG 7215 / KCTC 17166 / NRRL Y-17582) TaxID=931890 RepID=G8JUU9_ERECY|nr:hypothetical protein Ecym_6023 [Eremothecium cymbalariae DBVPG\
MFGMSNTNQSDLKNIFSFVENCNGFFLHSHCEIRPSQHGGLGVFATQDIEADTVLLRVPKSSIFSAPNSSIANLLFDEGIDGMLALNIAFIYETTVFKNDSHWFKYLDSIKPTDDQGKLILPPSCWPAESKVALKGTALDLFYDALNPEEEVEEGFEIAMDLAYKWQAEAHLPIPPALSRGVNAKTQFLYFVAVAYALSSRVFEIDGYHESALVPIADLFNHHPTAPNVAFESITDVCEKCGEVDNCGHIIAEIHLPDDQPADEPLPSNSDNITISPSLIEELEMAPQNFQDHEQHPTSRRDSTESSSNRLHPYIQLQSSSLHPDNCVDIQLITPVREGQEIYNSYGELTNSLLLARYGFCIKNNPHDVVPFYLEFMKLRDKSRKLEERFIWWEKLGNKSFCDWLNYNNSSLEDDDNDGTSDNENYINSSSHHQTITPWYHQLYVNAKSEPSPHMTTLLTLLALNQLEWRKFQCLHHHNNKIWAKFHLLYSNRQRNRKTYPLLRKILSYKKPLSLPVRKANDNDDSLLRAVAILVEHENAIVANLFPHLVYK